MDTIKRLAAIFVFLACLSSSGEDKWTKSRRVYDMPVSEASASAWKSPDESRVKVSFLKGGGRNGRDAISFKILKPIDKPLVVKGPEFLVPKCSDSVTRRILSLKMMVRQPGFVDGSVGICMVSPHGNKYPGIAGNRDFTSAYYSPRAKNSEWELVDNKSVGCQIRHTSQERRICLNIDFKALDGKGEYLIDSLAVDEICTISHRITSEAFGNIFFGETGKIKVSWAEHGSLKAGRVLITDEEGRKIKQAEAGAGEKETIVELDSKGFYNIEAKALYNDARVLTSLSTAAVVGEPIPEQVRRNSRFGLLTNHMGSDMAVKLGANYTSGMFNMNAVNPGPDGKLVSSTSLKDKVWKVPFIRLEGMVGGLPYWLRDPRTKGGDIYPPLDWEKFEQAVALWIKTNPNPAEFLAPYHEVNGAWKGSKEDLVRFHNVFAAAVKRERPQQKLSAPVFCNNDVDSLMELVRMGILKDIDAVNMHPYVNGTPPEAEFIKDIVRLKKELAAAGYGKLPIYFTEFGWTCDDRGWQKAVDSITRARYCARSLILCTAADIDGLVYFAGKHFSDDPVEHYWLVKADDTPWPSLAAYAGVIRELSSVKGGGLYLQLSPNVHMCFFKRDGKALVAAWTMNGAEKITFPQRPLSVHSMTGAELPADKVVELSPSPRYLEFESDKLANISADQEPASLFPSEPIAIDGNPVMCAGQVAFSKDGKLAALDSNAPVGEYTLILEKDGAYAAKRAILQRPVDVRFKEYVWDGVSKNMRVVFEAESKYAKRISGAARAAVKNARGPVVKFDVEPSSSAEIFLEIPARSGSRTVGDGLFEIVSPIRRSVRVPFEVTPISVRFDRDSSSSPDWEEIEAVDFSRWQRAPGDLKEIQLSPASADMKLFANKDGLHIRVRVKAVEHVQKKKSWPYMTSEDSIQFIFDMDSGKKWDFNNVNIGYNGHRVSEYAVSLTEAGKTQWWCYKAYFVKGNTGPVFGQKLNIARDDANKTTVYEFCVPWKLMGAEQVPQKGSVIGFSLVVNDKNKLTPKKMLKFGNGIPNPMQMLQLRLL